MLLRLLLGLLVQQVLIELQLGTTEGSNRQLKRISSGLGHLLGQAGLLVGAVGRGRLQDEWREEAAGLRCLEAWLLAEACARLLCLAQANLFAEARAHVPEGRCPRH